MGKCRKKGSLPFPFSVHIKQTENLFSFSSVSSLWNSGNIWTWTWRHGDGDMETWRHGDMETWRHEDMETWRHGDMETWRHGDVETWRRGDIETWRHRDMGTEDMKIWRHRNMDLEKSNRKRKTEAQAIFLSPFTIRLLGKRKFVICLFVREASNVISRPPRPLLEKLVPYIPSNVYWGNRPSGHPMLRRK